MNALPYITSWLTLGSVEPHPDVTPNVIFGLGWLYLILFAMNFVWTWRSFHAGKHFKMLEAFGGQEVPNALVWAAYSTALLLLAVTHFTCASRPEFAFVMPTALKGPINWLVASPVRYFLITMSVYAGMIVFRRPLANPTNGWVLLNASLLFLTVSMTDWDFRQIVGKPDNVPIVAMLFIVGYFTWLYFYRANENDQRKAEGRPVVEADKNEKVLVWPDLVYTEMICMIAVTAILVLWGIALQAPLEEPASSVKTPNPSKAPWYFLGLQEMLVYYDPWLAGVVFPSVIIGGMMAIPYIDFNKLGNGYYTFNERKFAVSVFMFGFLPLWIGMIILGTFMRGPNWNVFGIYEYWDVHKLEALNNKNLSEFFWMDWWGQPLPIAPSGSSTLWQIGYILSREFTGFVAVLGYLLVLPPIMAATVFRSYFVRMGFLRYMVFSNLVLMMAALPIKMVLRWAFNLKYFIAIPEWFFNV
jgi:cytochrome b/b6/petD-like protein